MRRLPRGLFWTLIAGLAWAEDIDAEIVKDLEFYLQFEALESQELTQFVDQETTEPALTPTQPILEGGRHD